MALLLLLLFSIIGLLLPPASCSPSSTYYACDWCRRHSTAAVLPPAAATHNADNGGACGYGDTTMAMDDLNGVVDGGGGPHFAAAAAGADLFRDGAGCGACYQQPPLQLRCRHRRLCDDDAGVKVVVVTDAPANRTGFLLPRSAFAAMARDGMADRLTNLGSVHVDFRRIPCEYKKKNLAVRVEEGSRNPGRLAVRFLYQGGQTDIAAVEIAAIVQHNRTTTRHGAHHQAPWRPMERLRRRRGFAWVSSRAPAGPLQLRLVVTAGFGGKWLRRAGEEAAALPVDWRPGQTYDTGIRVTDVALQTCATSCRARAAAGDEELR